MPKKPIAALPRVITSPSADASPDWPRVFQLLDATLDSPPPGRAGYAEFELEFENALAHQLGPFFEKLEAATLTLENIDKVAPRAKGAYYLILNDKLVYIGKSDAKAGLSARLKRHYLTLKARQGIDFERMKFKAVKVASFSAIDTESLLLDLHKRWGELSGTATRPLWNFSGFGSNDTGKERDTQKISIFDRNHPLDLDAAIDLPVAPKGISPAGTLKLSDFMKWLAAAVPFTFRVQKSAELAGVLVNFEDMVASKVLRELLLKIHQAIPKAWSVTVLRGKVILYKNDAAAYKSPVWRLDAGMAPPAPDYSLRDVGAAEEDEEPST